MDFSKFDAKVNTEEFKKDLEEAKENGGSGDFPEAPKGQYEAKIENLEIGTTKDGRPMFKAQLRLTAGIDEAAEDFVAGFKNKKPCLFMNRVLYGTKNDANMIQSVIGWLQKLQSPIPVVFENYSQFAKLMLDLAEDCDGLNVEIEYDPKAFNSISIKDVWED